MILDLNELEKEYNCRKSNYEEYLNIIFNHIQKILELNNVKIHSLHKRLKSFDSFVEKINRKHYMYPFKECTDIIGCNNCNESGIQYAQLDCSSTYYQKEKKCHVSIIP